MLIALVVLSILGLIRHAVCDCSPTSYYRNCWIRRHAGLQVDVDESERRGAQLLQRYRAQSALTCSRTCCLTPNFSCNLAVFHYNTSQETFNCLHLYCPTLESCILHRGVNAILYNVTKGVDPDLLVFGKFFSNTQVLPLHAYSRLNSSEPPLTDKRQFNPPNLAANDFTHPTTITTSNPAVSTTSAASVHTTQDIQDTLPASSVQRSTTLKKSPQSISTNVITRPLTDLTTSVHTNRDRTETAPLSSTYRSSSTSTMFQTKTTRTSTSTTPVQWLSRITSDTPLQTFSLTASYSKSQIRNTIINTQTSSATGTASQTRPIPTTTSVTSGKLSSRTKTTAHPSLAVTPTGTASQTQPIPTITSVTSGKLSSTTKTTAHPSLAVTPTSTASQMQPIPTTTSVTPGKPSIRTKTTAHPSLAVPPTGTATQMQPIPITTSVTPGKLSSTAKTTGHPSLAVTPTGTASQKQPIPTTTSVTSGKPSIRTKTAHPLLAVPPSSTASQTQPIPTTTSVTPGKLSSTAKTTAHPSLAVTPTGTASQTQPNPTTTSVTPGKLSSTAKTTAHPSLAVTPTGTATQTQPIPTTTSVTPGKLSSTAKTTAHPSLAVTPTGTASQKQPIPTTTSVTSGKPSSTTKATAHPSYAVTHLVSVSLVPVTPVNIITPHVHVNAEHKQELTTSTTELYIQPLNTRTAPQTLKGSQSSTTGGENYTYTSSASATTHLNSLKHVTRTYAESSINSINGKQLNPTDMTDDNDGHVTIKPASTEDIDSTTVAPKTFDITINSLPTPTVTEDDKLHPTDLHHEYNSDNPATTRLTNSFRPTNPTVASASKALPMPSTSIEASHTHLNDTKGYIIQNATAGNILPPGELTQVWHLAANAILVVFATCATLACGCCCSVLMVMSWRGRRKRKGRYKTKLRGKTGSMRLIRYVIVRESW